MITRNEPKTLVRLTSFSFVYFFARCAISQRETDSPSASTKEHACVYLIQNNVESLVFGEISPSIYAH